MSYYTHLRYFINGFQVVRKFDFIYISFAFVLLITGHFCTILNPFDVTHLQETLVSCSTPIATTVTILFGKGVS